MPSVRVDDRAIAYRTADRGSGERSIVFVHGSGADRHVWKAQDRLARRYSLTALDLSGHGASDDIDREPGPATLDAYVRDVSAVCEAVDADVLVGNSLGGAVVLTAVLNRDVSVDAIGLVGTGAKLAVREDFRRQLAEDFTGAVEAFHRPNWLFASAPEELVEASRTTMLACGQAVTERDFLTCHTFDVRDRLDEIDRPALAVCGATDRLTPVSYHTYLAREIDRGVLSVIDDAAHLVMLERPDPFNRVLESFVEDVT